MTSNPCLVHVSTGVIFDGDERRGVVEVAQTIGEVQERLGRLNCSVTLEARLGKGVGQSVNGFVGSYCTTQVLFIGKLAKKQVRRVFI